jgi:hypothetical protein
MNPAVKVGTNQMRDLIQVNITGMPWRLRPQGHSGNYGTRLAGCKNEAVIGLQCRNPG